MSAPRTKRQFAGAASDPAQRQITSFFSASSPATEAAASTAQAQQQAALPSSIQTNLLSVGMRVRKSVPEGYKTGTMYGGFKLWSDVDNGPVPASTSTPKKKQNGAKSYAATQRELLPFCGIHSIGGLSSQPSGPEHNAGLPGLDDIPGLSSSQETVDDDDDEDMPSESILQNHRKRIYDESEEDETEAPSRLYADHAAWLEDEVSPCSLAPSGWANTRPMAVPKSLSARKAAGAGGVDARPRSGQENRTGEDFEEADFLVADGMDLSDS